MLADGPAQHTGRLELTWTDKDRRLLSFEDGSFQWADRGAELDAGLRVDRRRVRAFLSCSENPILRIRRSAREGERLAVPGARPLL